MREFIARLRDWFQRDKLDRELVEVLKFHQQQLEYESRSTGTLASESHAAIAYNVRRQRHELGILSASGAERLRLVMMVLKQGATTTALGCSAGVLLSLVLSRFVEALLYETSPRDSIVYVIVLLVMSVTAVFASLGRPRRRGESAQ